MSEQEKKVSMAEATKKICEICELWLADDKEIFVSFQVGHPEARHWENWPLHSREVEGWIRINLYAATRKMPKKGDVEECQLQMEAVALHIRNLKKVYLRVSMHEGNLYVDLGTPDWSAIKITPEGWKEIKSPPVKFRRTPNMMPLPIPEKGGSIELLQPYINTKSREDFLLLVSWLIGAFHPDGPYPILLLTGRAGTAKSNAARRLLSFVNASQAPTQGSPKDEQGLMVMAEHNVAVCFDNSERMRGWLPNALCRLSTGSGLSMRKLYKNKDLVFFGGARPIIITSIVSPCSQTDFIDRTIHIELLPISQMMRQTEREMRKSARNADGQILGAIFDILSVVLQNLDKIKPKYLPRMADFAYWVLCAEQAIGWDEGEFLLAYARNRSESFEEALDEDVIAIGVERLVQENTEWEGTASDLINALEQTLGSKAGIPSNPSILSAELKKLAVALSQKGIEVDTGIKLPGGMKKLVRIKRVANCDGGTVITSPNSLKEEDINKEKKNAVPPSQNNQYTENTE